MREVLRNALDTHPDLAHPIRMRIQVPAADRGLRLILTVPCLFALLFSCSAFAGESIFSPDTVYRQEVAFDLAGLSAPAATPNLSSAFALSVRRFGKSNHSFWGFEMLGTAVGGWGPNGTPILGESLLFGAETVLGGLVFGTEASAGVAVVLSNDTFNAWAASAATGSPSSSTLLSFMLEPKLYTGVAIGNGWRFEAVGGYLWIPQQNRYSAASVAFRIALKTEVTVKGVDD